MGLPSFMSSERSPINDRERSPDAFRFATGNDLHANMRVSSLRKRPLAVNMSQGFETSFVNLFRKAKNDLEEGEQTHSTWP